MLAFSNKVNVWNREGFVDLLNITLYLHKHTDSAEHLKYQLQLRTFEKNRNTIGDVLNENARISILQFNENVRLNHFFKLLLKPCDI